MELINKKNTEPCFQFPSLQIINALLTEKKNVNDERCVCIPHRHTKTTENTKTELT